MIEPFPQQVKKKYLIISLNYLEWAMLTILKCLCLLGLVLCKLLNSRYSTSCVAEIIHVPVYLIFIHLLFTVLFGYFCVYTHLRTILLHGGGAHATVHLWRQRITEVSTHLPPCGCQNWTWTWHQVAISPGPNSLYLKFVFLSNTMILSSSTQFLPTMSLLLTVYFCCS